MGKLGKKLGKKTLLFAHFFSEWKFFPAFFPLIAFFPAFLLGSRYSGLSLIFS
jgi:hypothetical protein